LYFTLLILFPSSPLPSPFARLPRPSHRFVLCLLT